MAKRVRVCSISITYSDKKKLEDNLKPVFNLLREAGKFSPDIVCLPETFPFIGIPIEESLKFAEPIPGKITESLSQIAKEHGFWLIGGTFEKNKQSLYNSCFVMDEKGKIKGIYHKMFPTMGELENGITPGKEPLVLDTPWGKIGFAICFDMNFKEVMDSLGDRGAKLVFFITFFHGGMFNSIRSLTNSYYIVSARVMGKEGRGGWIVDPLGKVLKTASAKNQIICKDINLDFITAQMNWSEKQIDNLRKRCRREVLIETAEPEEIVMITSQVDGRNAEEIAKEFKIELLKDFLARARKLRVKNLR